MLKLRIKAPCTICRLDEETYEPYPIDIGEKVFLLEGCLNQDAGFLDNLAIYISDSDDLPAISAIFPNPDIKKDEEGLYVEINIYSSLLQISDNDLERIVNYIKGQVSDGWGENGFELYDGMVLEFDWKNVRYADYSLILFEEFNRVYQDYCLLARKNLLNTLAKAKTSLTQKF